MDENDGKAHVPSSLDTEQTTATSSPRSSADSTNKCITPVTILPPTVHGLLDCIRYETQQIEKNIDIDNDIDDNNDIEDAIDDGFFVLDVQVLDTKLSTWHEMMPNVTPYFAMKCNPNPMVVHWLARHTTTTTTTTTTSTCTDNNIGFDCASLAELELATEELKLSSTNNQDDTTSSNTSSTLPRMVYANPQRAEHDLLASLRLVPLHQSLWLTFDGVEELYKMQRACESVHRHPKTLQLIVRILVPDEHSQIPLGEKFGTALESISNLVETAWNLGLTSIVGVSFHCGSGCHDPETYQVALQLAQQAMMIIDETKRTLINSQHPDKDENSYNDPCWLLDIGGGFPGRDGRGGDEGRFDGRQRRSSPSSSPSTDRFTAPQQDETANAIAQAIRPQLEQMQKERPFLVMISEPGRYFVEASAALASRIYNAWWSNENEHDDEEEEKEQQEQQQQKGRQRQSKRKRVYQIAHGVHGVFKDVLLCNEAFAPIPLKHHVVDEKSNHIDYQPKDESEQHFSSHVIGPSGDPLDVVCSDYHLPYLDIGDWLVFDRMGAYTLSIASRTGRPIIRYVLGGSGGGGHGGSTTSGRGNGDDA